MSGLYLFDDAIARDFEPFALTRPVSELRAGVEIIRMRWERITGLRAAAFIGAPHLANFTEGDAPAALAPDAVIPKGSVVVNSRYVPDLGAKASHFDFGTGEDKVCAVRLQSDVKAAEFIDGKASLDALSGDTNRIAIQGRWLNAPWEMVASLPQQLADDIPAIGSTLQTQKISAEVIGDYPVFVEQGARIDPFVLLDASAGPILIRSGATVSAFSRLAGPLYIGDHVAIMGDSIASSSIGEWCKVRGELSNTIMLGHSNKGHTGFVGHSYLGRWVNLGSGTTTSNLKNTYGAVQVWSPRGIVESGMQFLGTLFGDHAKTGIGMMLTTGSVIGAGANIFGSIMPPKAVAPFSWGDSEPYSTFEEGKFLLVAARMMARRHVELDDKGRRHLKACYARRWKS